MCWSRRDWPWRPAAASRRVFSAMQRLAPVRGRLERAVISRAGAPVYVDYAHTADALEAAIAALRPHVSNRLITVFGAGGDRDQGKRPEMGAVAVAPVGRGDRHRRQSARRRSGEDPRRSARWRARRDRDRRPPRGHRRGDPHGARRATSSCSPARGTRPGQIIGRRERACPAVRRCARRRGSARHERALDLSRRSKPRPAGAASARIRSHRRHLRQPRSAARATCSSPCRAPSTTGTSSSTGPSPPARRARSCRSRSIGPHVLVDDTPKRSKRSAARRASGRRQGSSASPARSARPAPRKRCSPRSTASAGAGPSLGQELQQPYRRAAEPRPNAARQPVRGARNGHEQRGRDRRADRGMVRPHVALVTAIAPAHIENLRLEEAIADAKAEIFEGLEPGGIAIIPDDSPHRDRLVKAARRHAATHHHLRPWRRATCTRSTRCARENGGSLITARAARARADLHHLAARRPLGLAMRWRCSRRSRRSAATSRVAGLALADMGGLKGRGERHRIARRGRRISC